MDKPEQPNQELMIVKSIQGLISAANRELGILDKLIPPATERKILIGMALNDVDILQRTALNELQKAFE